MAVIVDHDGWTCVPVKSRILGFVMLMYLEPLTGDFRIPSGDIQGFTGLSTKSIRIIPEA
jgi:hypothetical protein